MNNIQRKPPVKARNYLKTSVGAVTSNILPGVEEITSDFLTSVNTSVSTFDGFFGEKPRQLSLTYELCNAYSNIFLDTSQYLWGPKATACLLKTIKELMVLKDFSVQEEEGGNHKEEDKKNHNSQNLKMQEKQPKRLSYKEQVLQKTSTALYKELEGREMIQNNMLMGNLLGMSAS